MWRVTVGCALLVLGSAACASSDGLPDGEQGEDPSRASGLSAGAPKGEPGAPGTGVRRVDFAGGAIVTGNTELPADVLRAIAGDPTDQPVWALLRDAPAETPTGMAY